MRPVQLLVLIGFTSVAACLIGRFVLRLRRAALARAGALTLEIIGFGVAFFAVNVAISMGTAIVMRRFVGFVSLYASNDVVFLLFSLLQGAVFATWRHIAAQDRS